MDFLRKNELGKKRNAREVMEYLMLRSMLWLLGSLSRAGARKVGAALGSLAYLAAGRLRKTGMTNLRIAYPEYSEAERVLILRNVYRSLGWQLGEFCRMQRYTRDDVAAFIRYEGLDHYVNAKAKGRGVLVVTGHLGAWELSSFYHSLMGHPISLVIRRLDNAKVDAFVNAIRSLHGNRVIHKDDFARGILTAMHAGETVGILMDTNMTPPQGVFVPFFGVEACTASGVARVALKSGAAVLPGFLVWEDAEQKYVLRFGEEFEVVNTGKTDSDIVANTAMFTAAIESYVRRYPGQWLWVHRRWKTRPDGGEKIY